MRKCNKDNKPIRILHVLGSTNHGGAQSFIMNIFRNVNRSNVQFDFVVHTPDQCHFDAEIMSLGGSVYRCPKYKGKNHFTYLAWWSNFFNEHPHYHIVHGHVRSTASIYLKVANNFNIITISHSHSTTSGSGFQGLIKRILQFPIRYTADYLFACSTIAGNWLFGNKACKTGDFYIINNSIEAEKFIFNESVRMLIRKELQIEDKFVIGHVGRFDEQKNHYGLIEIFKEVHDQKFNSVLLLVGNGKLKSQIEEKVNKLGLKDSVIFTGARSDVSELMQAMDIFVFPSLREGLGIVVIEAAASGLHCIVSDSIPKEAYVTSQIESVPLKDNAFIWAGKILNYSDGYERVNALENIKEHNYNVQDTANWIENFYLEVVDK